MPWRHGFAGLGDPGCSWFGSESCFKVLEFRRIGFLQMLADVLVIRYCISRFDSKNGAVRFLGFSWVFTDSKYLAAVESQITMITFERAMFGGHTAVAWKQCQRLLWQRWRCGAASSNSLKAGCSQPKILLKHAAVEPFDDGSDDSKSPLLVVFQVFVS